MIAMPGDELYGEEDDANLPKNLPPSLDLGPIKAPGSEPVVVLSGSSQVPSDWKVCSVLCVATWFVYMFRGSRPSDKNVFESVIPSIIETVDELLNRQIDNERAILQLMPWVFTQDPDNHLEFGKPNSFEDAFLSFMTQGTGRESRGTSLINMVRTYTSFCTAGTASCVKQQYRSNLINSLGHGSVSQWTSQMSVNDLVNLKLQNLPKKRYRSTCDCGGIITCANVEFTFYPMFLLVPCLTSYVLSQKGIHDFLIGDEVTLPGMGGDVAVYDVSAVSYISGCEGQTTGERHIIIIMRGNEDPAQLYMYDSRTARGAFVALRGPFPFVYVSSYDMTFHAQDIILKHRCMLEDGDGGFY